MKKIILIALLTFSILSCRTVHIDNEPLSVKVVNWPEVPASNLSPYYFDLPKAIGSVRDGWGGDPNGYPITLPGKGVFIKSITASFFSDRVGVPFSDKITLSWKNSTPDDPSRYTISYSIADNTIIPLNIFIPSGKDFRIKYDWKDTNPYAYHISGEKY